MDEGLLRAKNIYINDSLTIPSLDYILLSEYMVNECTKKFYSDYKSYEVPFSYVEFYFKLLQNYSFKFDNILELFFKKYNSSPTSVNYVIETFNKTFETSTKIVNIKNQGMHLVMIKKYFPLNMTFENDQKYKLRNPLSVIKEIIELIFYNEENMDIKQQYVEFLYDKYDLYDEKERAEMAQRKKILASKENKFGNENVSTNVSRVIIPKFKLPTLYPVSFLKSRVDSLNIPNRFLDSVRMIEILNKHRIVKVTYSGDFVLKRNALIKTTPKPKRFSDFF